MDPNDRLVRRKVWKLMDGQRTIEEIVAEVDNSFSEVPDDLFDEIVAFVDQLAEGGFVGYPLGGAA